MSDRTIYRDDYLLIREHHGDGRVAVMVGTPPEDSRPTIVQAEDVQFQHPSYLGGCCKGGSVSDSRVTASWWTGLKTVGVLARALERSFRRHKTAPSCSHVTA